MKFASMVTILIFCNGCAVSMYSTDLPEIKANSASVSITGNNPAVTKMISQQIGENLKIPISDEPELIITGAATTSWWYVGETIADGKIYVENNGRKGDIAYSPGKLVNDSPDKFGQRIAEIINEKIKPTTDNQLHFKR